MSIELELKQLKEEYLKLVKERDHVRAKCKILEHDWRASEVHLEMRIEQLEAERARSARLVEALQELVSQHMRFDEGKVFGHLILNAREVLAEYVADEAPTESGEK